MESLLILVFVSANVVLVSTTLWIISYLGQTQYTPSDNIDKNENFECGFDNTSIGDNQMNFKNIIVFSFLIVYDIELLVLLPISFNILSVGYYIYAVLFIIATIMYTCIFDIESKTLEYDN